MYIEVELDDTFDEIFETHENIKLWPFIGANYNISAKTKIMVLGESAYWEKNDPANEATRNNIYDYIENIKENGSTEQWTHATPFRNTAAMISGKGYYEADEKWNELVFYNFYQLIIGKNANDKSLKTNVGINLSQNAFFDVIKILKPDFIIAWGVSDLYKWLPQKGRIFLNKEKYLYNYEAFPHTVIWHIKHPSRGFVLDYWKEEYKAVKILLN